MSDSTVDDIASAFTEEDDERLAYRGVFQRVLVRPEIGAVIGAIAVWVFFWAVAGQFGTAGGTSSILDVSATLGIMAVAVALLMIGGEFDLSAGAATGALGIVTILLVKDIGEMGGAGLSLWIAIPLSFLVAIGLGWFNGTMVEKLALPSFIVTLATFFVLRGFKLGFSKLIIDNITVGRIEEGHGHGFWVNVFAAVWGRNDHQFEARDFIYTIGVIGGLSLIVLAVYEINHKRRAKFNPTGLGVFLAGLAGSVLGIIVMHTTDGVGANTGAGAIIAASMTASLVGLALWRYEPQNPGALQLTSRVLVPIGVGLGLVIAGIISAKMFDVDEQRTIRDQLSGFVEWILMISAGAGVMFVAYRRSQARGELETRGPASVYPPIVYAGVAAATAVLGFMFLTTEQGLRAILFVSLVIVGLANISIAASRAGRVSPLTRSAVLVLNSTVLFVLAFFIRSESHTPKFRTEGFTILLMAAGLSLTWAIVSAFFEQRSAIDLSADKLGRRLAIIGMIGVAVGIAFRLLFTTDDEIAAGIPPANFRMSIVWFIGVTIVATWVLGNTKFGSWIFAVGGNKEAARQIGVPAARTKTQLFMIVSVAAWLVGLLLAFRLNTLQSGTGNGLEFEYIIAAVVGGTFLKGGYGSAFGAAIGAVIMAMSKQGIPSARFNSDWRFAFLGVILLLAVIANNFIRTKAEAAR